METAPLFAEIIPLSEQEVNDYLDTIKNLSHLESRRQHYRKCYDVDRKLRERKLENHEKSLRI